MMYEFFFRRKYLASLFVVFVPHIIVAQLNLKIGYVYSYIEAVTTNSIIQRYNENQLNNHSKSFSNWHGMSGVDIGLRYRTKFVGIEGGWLSRFKDIRATLTDNTQDILKYNFGGYYVGLEFYWKMVGIGSTIGRTNFKWTERLSTTRTANTLIEAPFWSSRFYFLLEPPNEGGLVSLAIKPFIEVPWQSTNLLGADKNLNPMTHRQNENYKERWLNVGVSVVFYNGRHKSLKR